MVERVPFRAALRWMLGCCGFWVFFYNSCNWLTAHRAGVGQWYFAWELGIPFLPWMIVPYMSLDPLFMLSFFLCSGRREMETLGRRLILATLVAGAGFLLLPLTPAFTRPPVAGFYGLLFRLLRSYDGPYNLVPSLHLAYVTILVAHYRRHLAPPWRWLSHAWFALIGLSALGTHQHHVVDLATGVALGLACLAIGNRDGAETAEKGGTIPAPPG